MMKKFIVVAAVVAALGMTACSSSSSSTKTTSTTVNGITTTTEVTTITENGQTRTETVKTVTDENGNVLSVTDENGNPIKGIPRHPILEDNVIVYSNATILGRITIGEGCIVGANLWITRDMKPHTKKYKQEKTDNLDIVFDNGTGI